MNQNNILLESGTNELEIVEFYINEQRVDGEIYQGFYGINVAKVLEIIRMPEVTPLPDNSSPSVLGAFNLRSKIIPLIDLSGWLNKERAENDESKVIVSEFNQVTTAFLVSGVTRIHRLNWRQVEAPDVNIANYCSNSITGVVRFDGKKIVLILDMEKIVGDLNPNLSIFEESGSDKEIKKLVDDYKALVVDDSASVRKLMGKLLEKAGFEVTRTINGQMAWDVLQEYKRDADKKNKSITDYVDIIVSDIEMPVMDGHNLTKRIKADEMLKTLPVILFSSLITDRLRHKGEAVGADDQISKPDIQTLTAKAITLIEQEKAQVAA